MKDIIKRFIRYIKDEQLIISHAEECARLFSNPSILNSVSPRNFCYMVFFATDKGFTEINNKWRKIIEPQDASKDDISRWIKGCNYGDANDEITKVLSESTAKPVVVEIVQKQIQDFIDELDELDDVGIDMIEDTANWHNSLESTRYSTPVYEWNHGVYEPMRRGDRTFFHFQ